MQILFNVILTVGALASVANVVLLVFLGVFLVRLRDQFGILMKSAMVDLLEAMQSEEPEPAEPEPPPRKTWDEAYEEELSELDRRRRMAMESRGEIWGAEDL